VINYVDKIRDILSENMTERGYKLWEGINQNLPNIWDQLTSSTGKYHKKMNGEVPEQCEHVYHMLYSSVKLLSVFDIKPKTPDADKILMAIALHDGVKYGRLGTRKYVDNKHDKEMADIICQNKETFMKLFTEEQFSVLEEAVRFHPGRWSTDAKYNGPFSFSKYRPETLFIHILDMMSTSDLIQTDVRDNDISKHNTCT
jgi:hypothetical protein